MLAARSTFRSRFASKVSVVALLASAGTVSHIQYTHASCDDALHVSAGTITGSHQCAIAKFVSGDVTNEGTIGPPEDDDPAFLVKKEGIDGALINLGTIITGEHFDDDDDEEEHEHHHSDRAFGALTLEADITGGIDNRGTILSAIDNGIQIGSGGEGDHEHPLNLNHPDHPQHHHGHAHGPALTGAIVNSGVISAVEGDGIAALFGSMTGGLENKSEGLIVGRRGVFIAPSFDDWSGGILNDGTIEGDVAGIQIGEAYFYGKSGVTFSGGIENGEGGVILGKSGPSIYAGGESFSGGIENFGTITQELPEELEDPLFGFGTGILVTAETFADGIRNSGKIEGLAGPAIWITSYTDQFDGGIENHGAIYSVKDGVLIQSAGFSGGFVNTSTITGGNEFAGVRIDVQSFSGTFDNSGTISGGSAGVIIDVHSDDEDCEECSFLTMAAAPSIAATPVTGPIVNSGTLEAYEDALVLRIDGYSGTVTNRGLIEATATGHTAVELELGSGAIFENVEGGLIRGNVVLTGNSTAYDFVGGTGGVEGDLIGSPNWDAAINDDRILISEGTQYFTSHGGEGAGEARHFSSFEVQDGGTAILGANVIGSASGDGYDLNDIDSLVIAEGGHLYVDDQSQLNVGTFAQSAGSTLSFYLDEPPTSEGVIGTHVGQINVSGPVNLGGLLQAVINPLAFSGTNITDYLYEDVIVAGAPITTDFDGQQILGGSAFYRLEHDIDENTVDLRLVRLPFSSASCSENGDRLGALLEIIFQGGSLNAEQQALFNFLSQLPPDQVCDVYSDVGGAKLADFGSIVVETAGPWKNLVNDRMNGLGAVGCNLAGEGGCFNRFASTDAAATQVMTDASPGEDPFDWLRTGTRRVGDTGTWGRLVGVWGGTDSVPGSGGMDFVLTGGIAGVDHVFSPELLAGVAVQYTTDDVSFAGSMDSADISSFEAGAYASIGDTRFYLNVNASYIWHSFEVRRAFDLGGAFADYSGRTVSAYAEMGKIFETEDFRIQPLLALSFAHLQTDGYKEQGGSLALLDVQGAEHTSFKSMIGSRFAAPIELESGRKVIPEARVVWAHEFADTQSSFTAKLQNSPGSDPFVVQGRKYVKDSIILGAGLTAPLSDQASVSVDYDASINPDIVTHTVSAGLRLKW